MRIMRGGLELAEARLNSGRYTVSGGRKCSKVFSAKIAPIYKRNGERGGEQMKTVVKLAENEVCVCVYRCGPGKWSHARCVCITKAN